VCFAHFDARGGHGLALEVGHFRGATLLYGDEGTVRQMAVDRRRLCSYIEGDPDRTTAYPANSLCEALGTLHIRIMYAARVPLCAAARRNALILYWTLW
jgi:hypothetical protein